MNKTAEEIAENEGEGETVYTEKTFLQSILTSVVTIIICIGCFAGATWAWCTDDVSSFGNTIEAATYKLDVTVNDPEGNLMSVDKFDDEMGYYEYKFGKGTYTVKLEASGNATNCYCIVIIGDDSRYFTDLVSIEENSVMNFSINSVSDDVSVKFYTRGGSHEEDIDVVDEGVIDLTVTDASN